MTANATINNDIAALLPRLRRFARTIVYNREDADDLVQIAVERALARSAQWQPDTRLDSWIFRICLLYTSPSPRDRQKSRMPSSA